MALTINFKGRGFTPDGRVTSKCETCKLAVKRDTSKGRMIRCHTLNQDIHIPIYECSSYNDILTMSMYEMNQMAWIMAVNKKTKEIGFYSRKDFAKREDRLEKLDRVNPSTSGDFDPFD